MEDYFVLSFHYLAKPTDECTVLRRSSTTRPAFRAVSDAKTTVDDPRAMKDWHVVMLLLPNYTIGTCSGASAD